MDKEILNFLKDYKELFQDKPEKLDWAEIYNLASARFRPEDIGKFTEFWLSRETHPENYLTELPKYFLYESDIKKFEIPNNITSISSYAFEDCTSLTRVTIGNGVTSIGNYAFCSCTSLKSVTIGNGVTSIGESVFAHCTSLTSITIPDNVESIGDYVFYRCTSLTSVTIPDSLERIGESVFEDCTSLTTVIIRNPEIEIAADAFIGCQKLAIQFNGTTKQWKTISYRKFRNALYTCNCIDGVIKKSR